MSSWREFLPWKSFLIESPFLTWLVILSYLVPLSQMQFIELQALAMFWAMLVFLDHWVNLQVVLLRIADDISVENAYGTIGLLHASGKFH